MKKFKVVQVGTLRDRLNWVIKDTNIILPIKTRDTEVENGKRVVTLSREQLIEVASTHYGDFLRTLGFDWKNNVHMSGTPVRVAKSWIDDLARGVFSDPPRITIFSNDGSYQGMVLQKNIEVKSMCAHHNLPFVGIAHVGYIPGSKIIGLSKLNRIVDHLSRRPTVQETLTQTIHDDISRLCEGNKGVAVIVNSQHMCVSCRGIGQESDMVTSVLSGEFYDDEKTREELFMSIGLKR